MEWLGRAVVLLSMMIVADLIALYPFFGGWFLTVPGLALWCVGAAIMCFALWLNSRWRVFRS